MIDSKNNDTESPEDLPEEQASQLKVKDFGEEVGAVHNSGEVRIIFRVNFRRHLTGLTVVGKRAGRQEKERKGVDPSLQDNLIIQSGFFQHIYHIGCAYLIFIHSIINNRLILGGQNSIKRQTVFFLPIDPREKGHKDPGKIDLNVPRRAQYLHSAWKKHQDAVYWVDIDLAIK